MSIRNLLVDQFESMETRGENIEGARTRLSTIATNLLLELAFTNLLILIFLWNQ